LGIEVTRKTVVGDDLAPLRNAFDEAAKRVELVIASGGLGPTEDDRTRDAVADLLGRKLAQDPAVMRMIEARFRQIGRPMSEVKCARPWCPKARPFWKTIAAPRPACGSRQADASSSCFPARRTN
jgi:nicotinamide-nucleotide amidase